MTETFLQYYGIDWIGTATMIISLYLLGNSQKNGFWWGIAANISWIAFNVLVQSFPGLLLNVIMIALNIRGYRKWQQ